MKDKLSWFFTDPQIIFDNELDEEFAIVDFEIGFMMAKFGLNAHRAKASTFAPQSASAPIVPSTTGSSSATRSSDSEPHDLLPSFISGNDAMRRSQPLHVLAVVALALVAGGAEVSAQLSGHNTKGDFGVLAGSQAPPGFYVVAPLYCATRPTPCAIATGTPTASISPSTSTPTSSASCG